MSPLRLYRRLAAAPQGAQDQGPLRADTAAQEEGEAQESAKRHILRKSQCIRELNLISYGKVSVHLMNKEFMPLVPGYHPTLGLC